jgi:hypothetical protein
VGDKCLSLQEYYKTMRDLNTSPLPALLISDEPSIKLKVVQRILDYPEDSPEVTNLRAEIRSSARVSQLLSQRRPDGTIPGSAYAKWTGAHWVLSLLADLGYPPGDDDLIPLREQVLDWLLGAKHQASIRSIQGRTRRCASQEGNALYAMLSLGLSDERVESLAKRLINWQWPDGGWNCDKRPQAVNSSFMETLIPLRGLALHARLTGNRDSQAAALHAAEIFLSRRMYKRRRDGCPISADFLRLHYPCYWHYDILFGLKVIAEAGMIHDERRKQALDLLEMKRLPDGGFPAEAKYYSNPIARSGCSLVDWGGVSKRRMNPFVTIDALYVLKEARRF